ncbi:MAG: HEAT repeat domain-containing protein [Leptospiraceae bacterium]|nr:HEAT repeat domain-containing protein [Leptospiraceae bacterium]
MLKEIVFIYCIFIFVFSIFADDIEVHGKNLSSGTDAEKTLACTVLGKEKAEKKYITDIQNTLKNTNNTKVAIACANALGYLQEKTSIPNLKSKIMSESNSNVVYACLLSILNISAKNGYDSDAKSAIQYADIHHRQDEFVADLIDRIKSKFKD